MTLWLMQSACYTLVVGPFVATDGYTACTALTIAASDVRVSKQGAAFAAKTSSSTPSHMENGFYAIPVNNTDTASAGRFSLVVAPASVVPVWRDYMIVASNPFNAIVNNSTCFSAQVEGISASKITACSIAASALDGAAHSASVISSVTLAQTAANVIADYLLDRNVAGSSTGGRNVKEALFALRNRIGVSGTTVTIYGVNDTSACWVSTITTGAASGITNFDPA